MAAALLAALFAMGVFSASGVGAAVDVSSSNAPMAELIDTDGDATDAPGDVEVVTLRVMFTVDDEVDNDGGSNDDVTISVPEAAIASLGVVADTTLIAVAKADIDSDDFEGRVTVKQDGNNVGRVTSVWDSNRGLSIEVAPAASGGTNLAANEKVTVEIIGFIAARGSNVISVSQGNTIGRADLSVYSIGDLSASESDGTLTIEFTPQATTAIDIRLPYNLTGATVAAESPVGTDVTTTMAQIIGSTDYIVSFAAGAVTVDQAVTVTISGLGTQANDGDELTIRQGTSSRMFVVGEDPTDPGAAPGETPSKFDISSKDADKAVVLTLTTTADEDIRGANDIVVKLPGFTVPGSIVEDQVIIDGNLTADTNTVADDDDDVPENDDFYGHPVSISVSGTTITMALPPRMPASGTGTVPTIIEDEDTATAGELDDGMFSITFKQGAGLKTPNSRGLKTITVDGEEVRVQIASHISVPPASKWVERDTDVEVTAKGINAKGDATIHLHTAHSDEDLTSVEAMLDSGRLTGEMLAHLPDLDRSLMNGGTAVLNFNTSSSIFDAEAVDAFRDTVAMPTNLLIVVDAAGDIVGWTRLGLQPKVKLNLEEVRRTGRMGVTVEDWYYGNLSDIRVNGIQVRLPDPNNADASTAWSPKPPPTAASLTVVVPRQARLGEMEVEVSGTTYVEQGSARTLDVHTQTVNVGVFDLNISPKDAEGNPTAVTDQVIRIEGTGFGPSQCIVSLMVGDEYIRRATTGDRVSIGTSADCVVTDSDGTLSNSFKVPHNLEPGTYTVVARDALNRVGEGEITIPEPKIDLEPKVGDPPIASSQRGSTVTVIGENFPAEDVVGVTYCNDPVTVATTDTVGKWRANFKVPVDATIGGECDVVAQSEKKGTGQPRVVTGDQTVSLNAKATHKVPDEILMVSPDAVSSGQRLTIKAENLPLFTPVTLTIGGLNVAGRAIGDDDASDGFGRYEKVLLVPQLTVGTHNVELTVHTVGANVVVVTFVDILDIITRPTNEVFADLIEAGQLSSVWRYSIDETGSDWDSFDPQFIGQPGINDLELVSTGDIVWIHVTESVTFQGRSLIAGWNLISLE